MARIRRNGAMNACSGFLLLRYRYSVASPKTHRRAWEILRRIARTEAPRGAELGVYRGALSRLLLRGHRTLRLAMIDSWEAAGAAYARHTGDTMIGLNDRGMEQSKRTAEALTDFARRRRDVVRERTNTAARRFEDRSLDFVFIDADHSYEGCRSDLAVWRPKVKPGGWLCGHDYDHPEYPQFGVKRAVDDFIGESRRVLELGLNHTWFVRL